MMELGRSGRGMPPPALHSELSMHMQLAHRGGTGLTGPAVNVRFAPKATELPRRGEMSRRATRRHPAVGLISKRPPTDAPMNSACFAVPKAQQASGETAVERDAEIDQLKRELEILQARYAVYRRSAQLLRGFCVVFMPGLALVLAIKLFLFDTLYGLLFVGSVLLFGVVITRS